MLFQSKELIQSNKLIGFALITSYLSMNSFESKLWSLLTCTLIASGDGGDKSSCSRTSGVIESFSFVVKQNSFLANATDFRLNEYQTLKLFKDKHELKEKLGHLVRDLLFFNDLDLAFHFLAETDPADEHYSQNLMK